MNREIKFRAYIKTLKWIVPVSRINFDCETVEVDLTDGNGDFAEYDFDEIILMRFTGLEDKNGKEIYEGDIVKSVALANDHNQRGATVISPIEYWNGNTCLSLTYVPYYPFCLSHDIEVIGNTHDNLKEEEQCSKHKEI